MKSIEGGVTAPQGFRASGVAAAIKATSTKKDCALVVSDREAAAAGSFTRNLFKAPPLRWSEAICRAGRARAIFANSGNANACTGERGYANAKTTAGLVAQGLGIPQDQVCVLSTGVIGVPLPMDRIAKGVEGCVSALSASGGEDAAIAIMTTDTVKKEAAVELALASGTIRLGAIAKGSGMISPNMGPALQLNTGTMFCLMTTDAEVEAEVLAGIVQRAVDGSFNQICVDNDTSTSDSVICLANGASGVALATGSSELAAFEEAVCALCTQMAKALVRDGEGATKFVEITIDGTAEDGDAKRIARAIAVSHLCKTAFFGQDPNWGRISCAAGYAGVPFDPARVGVWIDDVQVMRDGMAAEYREEDAAACMLKPEFRIRVSVGDGPGRAVFWTSDLSYKYVEINADYRT